MVARNDFMSELLMDVVVPYELTMSLAKQPKSVLESVKISGHNMEWWHPPITLL